MSRVDRHEDQPAHAHAREERREPKKEGAGVPGDAQKTTNANGDQESQKGEMG